MSRPRHLAALLVLALLTVPASMAQARATDGSITRVAGTTVGFAGDGGPATQAKMDTPRDVTVLTDGTVAIADFNNDRIRQVLTNGTIVTSAGSSRGLSGDGGPAGDAELDRPRGVTTLPGGGYLIADTFNDRVRRVAPDGTITTIAGSSQGLSGDGGPATMAQLNQPSDTAVLPNGGFVIADTANSRVREVAPDGTISTVAGSTQGFGGDGGPATAAQLNQPRDVAVASDGAILIADTGNNRIRRVAPDGTISTVAGVGAGLSGDGDPALSARLDAPFSVAALPHDGILVADTGNDRVRRITPLGAIFTVAGTTPGDTGDGGLAKAAQLDQPGAVTAAPGGGFLVADTGNAQIRRVSDVGAVPPAVAGHSIAVAPASGTVTVRPSEILSFLPLQEEDLVPVHSDVDATHGHIDVTVAPSTTPGTQLTAEVYDSPFRMTQGPAATPFTDFHLPPLTGCATSATPRATIASATKRKKKPKPRRLWVSETGGHWRSSTGSTSASAVGTFWQTSLSCEGTRVTVRRGIVSVRDRLRRRTFVLHAGQTHLVRTTGRNQGQ